MTPTPRRRWPYIVLAVLIGLPALALTAAFLLLNAESLRPRLVAAVERATGRSFTIGEMRLALSLVPTVELRDVALANAPGASRPQMLTAKRVEVQAALLPLLSNRVEISRILLEEPDLMLEVDAQGRGNWQFARPPSESAATPASDQAMREAMALGIDSLRLNLGHIGWRDARTGFTETIGITRLEGSAPAGAAMRLSGEIVLRGQPTVVAVETGALAAWAGAQPWPVAATIGLAGAEIKANGTLTAAGAWAGQGEARAADLARLAVLLPGLPSLRDVAASAKASGTGGTLAGISDLRLTLGESDLSGLRPGLRLTRAALTAPAMDAPITLAAEALSGTLPLRITGQAGTPALALAGGAGPLPLDIKLEGTGVVATLKGTIAEPLTLRGLDLAITAEAADPAALTGFPFPGPLTLAGRAQAPGPGIAGGLRLTGLTATTAAGQMRGDISRAPGARVNLTGNLDFPRLDLDAMLAALAAPIPTGAPATPAPPPAAPPRPALPSANARVIPDIALPLASLAGFDANLRLTSAALTTGGQTFQQVAAHLVLAAGRARIAPLTATTPAGPLALELEADSEPPRIRVVARSAGLDLGALARLLGREPWLIGRAQLDADLAGNGADLRAVAATATGHLGLAMVDGSLSRAILRGLPADMAGLVIPGGASGEPIPLRCFALRTPAEGGVLRLATLYAEGGLGRLGGSGAIDLRDETLAVRLLTDIRAAGVALRAPVTIAGRWNAPRFGVDPQAAAAAGLGALLSQQATPDRSLQALADILGGGQRAASALGDCTTALTAARGGTPGPAPTAAAAPAEEPRTAPARPADLLRGLFGR